MRKTIDARRAERKSNRGRGENRLLETELRAVVGGMVIDVSNTDGKTAWHD
jgi:hypothetical protein